jgi:N-formylmaleamate deformylase
VGGPPPFGVEVSGSGPPMILIPGLTCGGQVWDGAVARFRGRYQCHVLTLAGFAGRPALGGPFVGRVRDALAAYVRDNGLGRPVIVGHSLGGLLAFWLAATAPALVGAVVAVDGLPYLPARWDRRDGPRSLRPLARALRVGVGSLMQRQFEVVCRLVLARMITDPGDLDAVAEVSGRSDPGAVGEATYEVFATDLRGRVGRIRAPVLLLGATADAALPARRRKLEANYRAQVAAIPTCRVAFAPAVRHFIQLDDPAFFFREVEAFLRRTAPARA